MKLIFLIFTVLTYSKQSTEVKLKTFPPNFKFGVATSAYQIEGAWNESGKGESIWDYFLHNSYNRRHLQPYRFKLPDLDKVNGDIACDSYHNYKEDVAMLKNLGVNYYRFSLSWSRILPTGFINKINEAGVDYYRNLIRALKANKIEPFITLYHWDLPQPLQDIGGWTNPLMETYFADYARLAFKLFGNQVKLWSTFNEPKQTCHVGYGFGLFPPGVKSSGIGEYLCAHTVIKSHAEAYHIYKNEFKSKQNGKVTFVVDSHWFEPETNSSEDQEAAERKMQFNFGWFANPVYHPRGNYPAVMIERIAARSKLEGFPESRLPKFSQKEVDYIKGTFDFFGLNSYTTFMVKWKQDDEIDDKPSWDKDLGVTTHQKDSWPESASFWLKVVPWGIRKLLKWIDKTYNHPEIIITENGYSDHGEMEDDIRINYLQGYLSNILDAINEDKVRVTGYTVWSLMDNFEWVFGYTQKFGLFYVDFSSSNRTRTMKKSGWFYKNLIGTQSLS